MFCYNIRTDNISLFLIKWISHLSSLFFPNGFCGIFFLCILLRLNRSMCANLAPWCLLSLAGVSSKFPEQVKWNEVCSLPPRSSCWRIPLLFVVCLECTGSLVSFSLCCVACASVSCVFWGCGFKVDFCAHDFLGGNLWRDGVGYRIGVDLLVFGWLIWGTDVGCSEFDVCYQTRFGGVWDLSYGNSVSQFCGQCALSLSWWSSNLERFLFGCGFYVYSFCGWFIWWRCFFVLVGTWR